MKLPRDLEPERLEQALKVLGYRRTRQTGSHIRVTTERNGQHHEVIPKHATVKTGTLHSILSSVAHHHGLGVDELLVKLRL